MINMTQFHFIKFLKEVEGLSQRQIATKLGISRNTVSKYLKQMEAPTVIHRHNDYGKKEHTDETKRILPIIDQWIEDDLKNWKKQKHTAARIFRRLEEEYDFKGSESNIRKIIAKRRKKLQEIFIPLEFQLGHQFQFDWGEADVILQGRTQLREWCLKEANEKNVPSTKETVLQMWEKEKELLHPLPKNEFEACKLVSCQVNKTALISIETNQYSVPCRFVGHAVWAKFFVDRVIVVAQNQEIAEHVRSYERHQMLTVLDHYLEILLKKPRAIRDAHAFHSSDIPDVFRRFQHKMRDQEGAEGDRKFIRLLLLHREIGMEKLTLALEEAEQMHVFRYEIVHEIIQRLLNAPSTIQDLSKEKTPINLLDYKVKKSNVAQYEQLTGGQEK
jgi:predicted transcriptional regulator